MFPFRVVEVPAVPYRAQCALAAVLLDTRSGILPFSIVVTRDRVAQKVRGDFTVGEATRRAQLDAVWDALRDVAGRLGEFLAGVPVAVR